MLVLRSSRVANEDCASALLDSLYGFYKDTRRALSSPKNVGDDDSDALQRLQGSGGDGGDGGGDGAVDGGGDVRGGDFLDFGLLGSLLGASWGLPGTSWGVPGPPRGALGASWGSLGAIFFRDQILIDFGIDFGRQEGAQRVPRGSY